MTWGSWDAFWAMGGYGLYVWGSYAMVLVILALEVRQLKARRRAALQELAREQTRARSTT